MLYMPVMTKVIALALIQQFVMHPEGDEIIELDTQKLLLSAPIETPGHQIQSQCCDQYNLEFKDIKKRYVIVLLPKSRLIDSNKDTYDNY